MLPPHPPEHTHKVTDPSQASAGHVDSPTLSSTLSHSSMTKWRTEPNLSAFSFASCTTYLHIQVSLYPYDLEHALQAPPDVSQTWRNIATRATRHNSELVDSEVYLLESAGCSDNDMRAVRLQLVPVGLHGEPSEEVGHLDVGQVNAEALKLMAYLQAGQIH
jgi:hypothetical protein